MSRLEIENSQKLRLSGRDLIQLGDMMEDGGQRLTPPVYGTYAVHPPSEMMHLCLRDEYLVHHRFHYQFLKKYVKEPNKNQGFFYAVDIHFS